MSTTIESEMAHDHNLPVLSLVSFLVSSKTHNCFQIDHTLLTFTGQQGNFTGKSEENVSELHRYRADTGGERSSRHSEVHLHN